MNAQLTTEALGTTAQRRPPSLESALSMIEEPSERPANHVPTRPTAEISPMDAGNGADATAVDLMAVLARCLGNIDLVVRVLSKFRNTGTADLAQIEMAIERSDFRAVAEIAHRFKGAAANVSASRLHVTATYLEELGREQNGAELRDVFNQLNAEWESFVRFAYAFAPAAGVAATRAHALTK